MDRSGCASHCILSPVERSVSHLLRNCITLKELAYLKHLERYGCADGRIPDAAGRFSNFLVNEMESLRFEEIEIAARYHGVLRVRSVLFHTCKQQRFQTGSEKGSFAGEDMVLEVVKDDSRNAKLEVWPKNAMALYI